MKSLGEQVHEIMLNCLYPKGTTEFPADGIKVEGIVRNFGFDPKKIEKYKDQIESVIREMPKSFFKGHGGGMSFLQLCEDKHGNQWGEHPIMEELVVLGIASGKASYCLPREMWKCLPGEVPYIVFDIL
jgi:hypothetical protein